jgi:phosphoribosylaminoimidazole-succinocarboxamide synthase
MMQDIIDNQLTSRTIDDVIEDPALREQLRRRSLVVKRLKPLPIEAVVRGYLIGSGWKDYQETGKVCGIPLPPGLRQAERLPETLFTPASKAESGAHDENITFEQVVELIGERLASRVRDVSIQIYEVAATHALQRGIIIADTKFEFGLDDEGRLYLIDEVLTPDSSRFWPVDKYEVGISPPSFDKQFVRDYLETLDWDKTAPGPELPAEIISKTAENYQEALRRLTKA